MKGTALEANMFDSIEDQMKNVAMSGSTSKEKWTRYIVISAIAVVAVGGIVAAVELLK
jgi:hypothetical protein